MNHPREIPLIAVDDGAINLFSLKRLLVRMTVMMMLLGLIKTLSPFDPLPSKTHLLLHLLLRRHFLLSPSMLSTSSQQASRGIVRPVGQRGSLDGIHGALGGIHGVGVSMVGGRPQPTESRNRRERNGFGSIAVDASHEGGKKLYIAGEIDAKPSNGGSGGASSGMMGRIPRATARAIGVGPSSKRVCSGTETMEVSNYAGRFEGGARDGGSGAVPKPRSGRYSRLARYGPEPGSSQSQGSASKQYKAPQVRAYSLRSGAAQFGASAMGFGGLGGGGGLRAGGAGAGLGADSAGLSAFTSQEAELEGVARSKSLYGAVPTGSDGVLQSYGGRKGSSATVGLGGGTSGSIGGVGVGFGRHKYG